MRKDVICLECSNGEAASEIHINSSAESRSKAVIDSKNILRVSRIARRSNVMSGCDSQHGICEKCRSLPAPGKLRSPQKLISLNSYMLPFSNEVGAARLSAEISH